MAAATQMHVPMVSHPQWLDLPEHEKENNSSNEEALTRTGNDEKCRAKVEPIHDWQRQKFEEWLTENSQNMYPTREEKENLASLLSVSYVQVTRLFANHRRRIHKIRKSKDNLPEANSNTELSQEAAILVRETCSERSASPTSSLPNDDDSVAAICSSVADLIHVDQENKKCLEKTPKKKARKRKCNDLSGEAAKTESTMDEILIKIGRKVEQHSKDEEMSPAMSEMVASSNSEAVNNSLLSMVNSVVNQPPPPLPHSVMADVNPRLLEAMDLLNKGVQWTHPKILAVLIQILHQQQQQQREQQFAQQRAYLAHALTSPVGSSPPPASESANSHSSSKSTEELMSTLSPDEYLAVNVLTDLANEW